MKVFGYFADFLVFPFVLAALLLLAQRLGASLHPVDSLVAILSGMFLWTFLEYAIHRFVLHGGGIFSDAHDAHHAAPKAYIGTPTWLTLTLLTVGIYLPATYLLYPRRGLMLSFGVTLAYLIYSFAHYTLHHLRFGSDRLFQRWKRLHALHHFAAPNGNFGVTSSLWDHVFGTAVSTRRSQLVQN
jgi:sterol desaturase/sphingolipid hydroxylase (fatty acid hydroxylase superfamily)